MSNVERKEGFTQVCVWEGTLVGSDKVGEFEAFIKSELGARIQYLEEIKTKPDVNQHGFPVEGTGGRNDVFFAVHCEDISKFAVPRLAYGIRWVEDALAPANNALDSNGVPYLYPSRVLDYKTW